MYFYKVQNHTPYNFPHSEPTLCHHLIPVDERLEEQRNKTKKRNKIKRERAGDRQQHQEIQTRRLWLLEWWPWRAFSASAWYEESEGDSILQKNAARFRLLVLAFADSPKQTLNTLNMLMLGSVRPVQISGQA